MICILNTIISYFGIEQAVLQRIDVIDFDRNQKEARVHFIPNLKVGVLVSSPGEFHPQALRTVREILTSYGSHYPASRALFCPLVPPLLPRLTAVQNWIIQSLRSMPITGTSLLLRIVPPLHNASILSSLWIHHLEFSLNINVHAG